MEPQRRRKLQTYRGCDLSLRSGESTPVMAGAEKEPTEAGFDQLAILH